MTTCGMSDVELDIIILFNHNGGLTNECIWPGSRAVHVPGKWITGLTRFRSGIWASTDIPDHAGI